MRELNINENTSQWLITGFMLVNGVMIPLTAYLMDKVKTRPLYLGAMGTFLIGSIVAAIAPNFGVLMFARVIQAVGAGILMPLMQFTLFTLFSKEHRGFAMGLAGLVIQFAPAIGPTFTGLIIDNASWRVPFIVIVGIALVTIVLCSLLISLIIIGIFVKRQITISNPLLNLKIFNNKIFCFSTITSMIIMLSMVGPALLIPLYVQNALGLSALLSGLVIMPGAIINGIMSVFTGKFYDKYGPRPLIFTGFILLVSCTFLLCFLKVDTSYTYLIVIYAIRMFAVSLLMMPINTTGINALKTENISHGTAIMNFGRVMAGSLGTALMVNFMSIGDQWVVSSSNHASKEMIQRQSVAAGVDVSFALVTVFVIIAFVLALFIKEPNHSTHNSRKV